ncbi:MAG: ATP synthase F1 subunit delta [Candidatus Binatia bacterium]|nr:ATP synthase F1 subunit delta [Candidatus Binatia bacterium]
MTGGLAKRYARALLSVAKEENRLEEVASELESISSWLADEELSDALTSPALTHENRQALVAQMTESLGLSDLTKNFLGLVTEQHRLDHFTAMQQAYGDLVDRELNRLRAHLRSAQPVSDAQQAEIGSALEAQHGKKILLSVEVDPSLVAGITVEIEGKTYDGSARTQLANVAQTMSRQGSAG